MSEPDNRKTDPNDDPGTGITPDSDDAPTYYGLENAVPDTRSQMQATEQPAGDVEPEERVVASIEVIHPKDFIRQVWPEEGEPEP